MADTPARKPIANRILCSLSPDDHALLAPALHAVDLPLRKQLESRNRRIEYIYFPDRGFASVVAHGARHGGVEIGIIGREGMTGLAVILETDRSPHETYMQLAGSGWRMGVGAFRAAIHQSRSLERLVLRWAHAFTVQTAQTALAIGRYKISERLARWLLMGHDRIDGGELRLTHEFLALMLGVRRPGVTEALKQLQEEGLIQVRRGGIVLLDRLGLEQCANGAYGVAESELQRLSSMKPAS